MFYKKGLLKVTLWCRCFAVNFGKFLGTPPGAVNLDQSFEEDSYKKLHDLPKSQAQSFLNDKLTQVTLHSALIAYIFFGNFWISGNANPFYYKIMLIRILSLKNDSCIFFSALEFLHFDFLSGDSGATTWTKFVCNISCFIGET